MINGNRQEDGGICCEVGWLCSLGTDESGDGEEVDAELAGITTLPRPGRRGTRTISYKYRHLDPTKLRKPPLLHVSISNQHIP